MKHVFYVFYILFYTGAVFLAGIYAGQRWERFWAEKGRTSPLPTERRTSLYQK